MAVQRVDKQIQPSLSSAEYNRIAKAQAEERTRRGFKAFTRDARREEVMGATGAEARLNTAQRYSQVTRKGGR